jgi:hypothetical protein
MDHRSYDYQDRFSTQRLTVPAPQQYGHPTPDPTPAPPQEPATAARQFGTLERVLFAIAAVLSIITNAVTLFVFWVLYQMAKAVQQGFADISGQLGG